MRKVIFSCLLLLGGLVCSGQESWRGWENAVDLSVMDGFDQQLSPVSIDVEVARGYRFNKLFVGLGVGAGYTNGLLSEIHHFYDPSTGGEFFQQYDRVEDSCWSFKGLLRAKYSITRNSVSPFVSLDAGYNLRIGDWASARMKNGLFVEPSVGCDFSFLGKSFFVNIGYQYFYYEYLYERTPHTALSSGYMAAKWSGGLVLHLGYNF